jgi:hypothetical protein
LAQAQSGKVSNTQNDKTGNYRATEGDTVWVLINHIRPDKRQQFEKFIYDVLWPVVKTLSPQEQLAFRQTRFLTPTQPEADGTYSYIFFMDPVITGVDYDIDHLLKRMYSAQEVRPYEKMFLETVAREQTWNVLVQRKYLETIR